MGNGAMLQRRRKRRHHDSGARLVPGEVDVDITGELFDDPVVRPTPRRSTGEYVIDLPAVEKPAAPLPRRVETGPLAPS
jgi:hypothetical protein